MQQNLAKLTEMQKPSGGWPWFEGMQVNRMITLNIVTSMGQLEHLGVRYAIKENQVATMVKRAIKYLDEELVKDYKTLNHHA